MTVQLRYNAQHEDIAPSEAANLLEALADTDGSTSDTGGTYDVTFQRYQFDGTNRPSELHFDLELTDVDDDQYPNVKDDLAETVASLAVLDVTAAEATDGIEGQLL